MTLTLSIDRVVACRHSKSGCIFGTDVYRFGRECVGSTFRGVSFVNHRRMRQLMQQGDSSTRELFRLIQKGNLRIAHEDNMVQNYLVHNCLIYRKYKDKLLLIIPKSMRKGIVIAAHDLQGHFAVGRTVDKITEDYWFAGLWSYVNNMLTTCQYVCGLSRPQTTVGKNTWSSISYPSL
jgi:hypothetical protein